MKYYKLISDPKKVWKTFKVGKIYPDTFIANKQPLSYWLDGYNESGHLMQEVAEEEYNIQEGIVKEFVLPEKWYIIPKNEEEDKVLCDWRGGRHTSHYSNAAVTQSIFWVYPSNVEKDHTEITFNQFKEFVLKETPKVKTKTTTKSMKKEIIGYKLTKTGVASAAKDIAGGTTTPERFVKFMETHPTGNYARALEEAGVLNLWFTPIYKEEAPKFKEGDIVVVLRSSRRGEGCNNPEFYKEGLIGKIDKVYEEEWSKNPLYYWVHLEGEKHNNGIITKFLRLAKISEIEEYNNNVLLAEAKKIYVPGTFIISPVTKRRYEVQPHSSFFVNTDGHIDNGGLGYLYQEGQWAEIVTEPVVIIQGYTAKFKDNGDVVFGCQTYTKEFVLTLDKAIRDNGFEMNIAKEVHTIAEYLRSK